MCSTSKQLKQLHVGETISIKSWTLWTSQCVKGFDLQILCDDSYSSKIFNVRRSKTSKADKWWNSTRNGLVRELWQEYLSQKVMIRMLYVWKYVQLQRKQSKKKVLSGNDRGWPRSASGLTGGGQSKKYVTLFVKKAKHGRPDIFFERNRMWRSLSWTKLFLSFELIIS